ncbi:MAG: hypothetical protein RLZ77_1034 [Bacteroidota bacterium]
MGNNRAYLLDEENQSGLKCKKADRRSEKLFIGLTTKPCLILKNETKTTQLSFQMLLYIVLDISFLGKKALCFQSAFPKVAVWTGLEPATPCVTGMYSNQLNYQTLLLSFTRNFNSGCKYSIEFYFCKYLFLFYLRLT